MSLVIVNGQPVFPERTFEERVHQAHRNRHDPRACRVCGCTDLDCSGCVDRTGKPCSWVAPDLCSACAGDAA